MKTGLESKLQGGEERKEETRRKPWEREGVEELWETLEDFWKT